MFSSVMMLNPPAHTRLRRLVAASFTARRVAGLRPAVERIVADACEQIAGDSDFVTGFAVPLPVTVIGELLGIPAADRPMFADLARDWSAVLEVLSPPVVDRATPPPPSSPITCPTWPRSGASIPPTTSSRRWRPRTAGTS
jgi:cytochrome P450